MTSHLTRRNAITLLAAVVLPTAAFAEPRGRIRVHKDPDCGCCSGWVQHLQSGGFAVQVEETHALASIRKRLGVPDNLAACHTAEIDGYVIEGHVPAVAIRRLLEERPVAAGLAVPGMPVGSPGMEGGQPQKYAAILFGKDGQRN